MVNLHLKERALAALRYRPGYHGLYASSGTAYYPPRHEGAPVQAQVQAILHGVANAADLPQPPQPPQPPPDVPASWVARRVRPALQMGLLSWLRDVRRENE